MITTHTWLNGTIVENSKATVPFLTSGFHYGIGVFEGIRAYDADKGAAVFRLREHLERFHGSSLILGFLEQPYSVEELTKAVKDTIKANGFGGCYIRPFLWLGDGGWNLTLDTGKPLVGVAVWKQSVYLGQTSPDVGMKMMVSSYTRHHPNAMMTKAKVSGNYVNSFIAKTEAQRNGFDEAVLLAQWRHGIDVAGRVAAIAGQPLKTIDLGGTLVIPSFVEGHVHLDTSFHGDVWRPHVPYSNGFNVQERVAIQADNMAKAAPMAERWK
jgi:hypothetical protein